MQGLLSIFVTEINNTMKTIILNIPAESEKWFQTLLHKLRIKHKILTTKAKEDLLLAKLIDEAMKERGEIDREKVLRFVKKHAGYRKQIY